MESCGGAINPMNSFRYTGTDPIILIGVGPVKPGQTIKVHGTINHPQFELVTTARKTRSKGAIYQP
jgi:hypothetical protein